MSKRSSDKALQEFLSESQEIVEAFSKDLLVLDEERATGNFDPDRINGAFRSVHSLKGLSGLFGVESMATLSHTLENLLDSLRLGKVAVSPQILDLLFEAVELYGRLIADRAEGRDSDASTINDFLARLEDAVAGDQEEEGGAEASDYDLDPSVLSVLTEYEEHRLRENLKQGKKLFRLRASFDLMTIDKELEALKTALKPLGEVITYLPSPESDDPARIDIDVIVGSDSTSEKFRTVLNDATVEISTIKRRRKQQTPKDTVEVSVQGTPAPVVPVEELGTAGAAAPLPDTAAAPRTVAAAGASDLEERPASLKSVSQTVRVDIRKLDHLMNIVGELSIVRSGINAALEILREEAPNSMATESSGHLQRESRTLERKLNELQTAILDVRMVPFGQIFDKLSRVVRKISRESEKEIRFLVTGADTEIDKLIVEELSDPLMHIIRNSIDHGIEDRETRKRNGKAEAGTISVSAEQKGNHVLLQISDDGAGFDEERILETALERQLIDVSDAADMSRRELLGLVFLPGFSTREEATELSGRGVGMDVVKHNIARLSGIIDMDSWSGRGSRMTITLPLTLAIIPALIIEVAEQTFAVPLNSVLESLTVSREELRIIENRSVIDLRGQTLAISRLDEVFDLDRTEPRNDEQFFVVVVGMAEHRLGLVVDDLIGQQDIVIKTLGSALSSVRCIAGATELGGQKTVLVLDVASLVEETLERSAEAA